MDDIQKEAKNCVAKSKEYLKDYSFLILAQLKNTIEKNDYSGFISKPGEDYYGTPQKDFASPNNRNARSPDRMKTFKNYSDLIKNITKDKIDVVGDLKAELEDKIQAYQKILSTLLEENRNLEKQNRTDNKNAASRSRQIKTEASREEEVSGEIELWSAEKPSGGMLQVLDLERNIQELRNALKTEEGTISSSKQRAQLLAEDLVQNFEKLKANFLTEEREQVMKTPKHLRNRAFSPSDQSRSPKAEDSASKNRDLNQVVVDLKKELDHQSNRNLVLSQKLEAAIGEPGNVDEVKTLRFLLEGSKDEIKRLQTVNGDLAREVVEKTASLRDLENAIESIAGSHKKMIMDFKEQREYTANLELLADGLETQALKLKKDIALLEGANSKLENENKLLKKSQQVSSPSRAGTANQGSPKDRDSLLNTCMMLEKENQSLREEVEQCKLMSEEALEALARKLQHVTTEKESLKFRLIQQSDFIARLENELSEKSETPSPDVIRKFKNDQPSDLELEVKKLQETIDSQAKQHILEISNLRAIHEEELQSMKQATKPEQTKGNLNKSQDGTPTKKHPQQLDDVRMQLQGQENLHLLAEKQKLETQFLEENQKLKEEILILRSLLDDAGDREQIEQLESSLKHLNAKIKEQSDAWQEKENAYQAKLEEMNADYEELKQKYNEDLEKLGDDMESALLQREELHKELGGQYLVKIAGLEQELALVQESKESLAEHLRQLQESLKDSGDQVANKEIDRLLEQIDALQNEIAADKETIAALQSEINEHKRTELALKEQIKTLITCELAQTLEIASLKSYINETGKLTADAERDLSNLIKDAEKRYVESQNQLELAQKTTEEAEKERFKLHQELMDANHRFVESEKIIINLQGIVETSNQRIAELKKEQKEIQTSLENFKNKNAELEKGEIELRKQLEKAQGELGEAEKAKAALVEKLETVQSESRSSRSSEEELQQQLEKLRQELEDIQGDRNDLSRKLDLAQKQIIDAETSRKELEAKLKATETQIAELTKSSEEKIGKLEEERTSLQEKLSAVEKQIGELEQAKSTQEEIYSESGNIIQQLRQERIEFQEEANQLSLKVQAQSETIAALDDTVSKLKKEKENLQEELSELKKAQQAAGKSKQLIQDLQNKYREKEAHLQAKIAELTEENGAIQKSLTEKYEKQYEELEQLSLKKTQNLEEQIANLQEENRSLAAEIETLRSSLEKPIEESEEMMFSTQTEEIRKEFSNVESIGNESIQMGGAQRNRKRREQDKKASMYPDRDETEETPGDLQEAHSDYDPAQRFDTEEFDSKSHQRSDLLPEGELTSETQDFEHQPGSPSKGKNFDWKTHYKNLQKAYDRARDKIKTLSAELNQNKRKQTKALTQVAPIKERASEGGRGNRRIVYVQKTNEEGKGEDIETRHSVPVQLVESDKKGEPASPKKSKGGSKKSEAVEKQSSNQIEINYYKKTIIELRNQILDFEFKLKQEIHAREKEHEQKLQETEERFAEEMKKLKEQLKAKDREIDDLRWDEAIKMNELEKEVEKRLADKFKAPTETKKKKK